MLDTYDDVDFSALVVDALHGARAALGLASLSLLKAFSPRVCLLLYADGERLRPVLNFSTEAILALAEAESSFDFDPYIYE
ncbi:hypothetical protein [Massilia violaceinigra]|uniref:hypothetical protein n=1 Tax=Massilia violaceinigra TaxID=2045208 RepID=UPI0012FDC7ED|nr:hypothetical protein [Massilia violaceinigra]